MPNFLGSGSMLEPNRVKQTARKSTGGRPPKPRPLKGLFSPSSADGENDDSSSQQRLHKDTPNHRDPWQSAAQHPPRDMSTKQNPQQNGQGSTSTSTTTTATATTTTHAEANGVDVEMWSAPTSNVRGGDETEEVAMTAPSASVPAINNTASSSSSSSSPMHVGNLLPPTPPPKRSKCQRCSIMRSEPVCEPTTGSKKCGKCYRDHRNCSWTTDTWELSSTTPTSPRKRKPSPIELSNSDSSDLSPSPPPLPKTPRRRVKKDRRGQPREINGKCVRCASFTNSPPCERSDDPTDLKCKKCRRDKQSCSFAPYYGRRKAADDKDDETEDVTRREPNDEEEEEDQDQDQERSEESMSKPEKAKEKRSKSPGKPAVDTFEREKKEAQNSKEKKQEKDRAKEVAKPAEKEADRDTQVKMISRLPGKEKEVERPKEKVRTAEELAEAIFSERLKEREKAKIEEEKVKAEKTKTKEKIGVVETPKQGKSKEGKRNEGQGSKRLKEGIIEKPAERQKEGKDKMQKAAVAARDNGTSTIEKDRNSWKQQDRGNQKEKADDSDATDGKKRKEKEKVVESVATKSKKRKEEKMDESDATNSKKGKERGKVDKSEAANTKKRKERERADESEAASSKKRREQERTKDMVTDDDRPTKKHKAHIENKSEENSASVSNGPSTETRKTTPTSPSKPNNVPKPDDLRVPASEQGVASPIPQESEIAMAKNVDAEPRAPSQTRLQSVEENQHRSLQVVARELSAAEFKASSHRALAESFLKDAERADQEVARLKEEMVSIVRKKVDFGEIERNKLIEVLGRRSEAP